MEKPKEFWVAKTAIGFDVCTRQPVLIPDEFIHVIEFSAYQKAMQAVEVMREALKMSEGYIFMLTQPDKGDIFGEWDEKYHQALARADELLAQPKEGTFNGKA